MDLFMMVLRIVATVVVAVVVGKLVTKVKLPAILGWLLTGMVLGPYALGMMSQDILDADWYHNLSRILECAVGVMFAKELVWRKIKAYGKQIAIITLFQSLGTFTVVTLCFGALLYFMNLPLYLALLFGGIAMATAPAPSLAVVNQFQTKGPMTNTLVPMAMLDDIVALIVFFSINAYVAAMGATGSSSVVMVIATSVLLPIAIGIVVGFLASPIFAKEQQNSRALLGSCVLVIAGVYLIGYLVDNFLLPQPAMNFMMLGMATFATVANRISEERMEDLCKASMPVVGMAFVLMILNLAAPLDYHLILSAGVFTAIYIVARAAGKYFTTRLGATVAKAGDSVKKYLGFTLLPHSGVSLVFTGMAVTSLSTFDTEGATLIKGTIAAAAIINEIIAVILAKKAFEWGKELPHQQQLTDLAK